MGQSYLFNMISQGCGNKVECVIFLPSQIKNDFSLQAQKINLICEGTFEIAGLVEVDVNDKDQILARTRMDNRNIIKVMNRLSGEVSSAFPSECDHWFISRLAAHPTEASFVLECCSECCVIRNYNIHSGQCSIVYKGTASNRICHGPTGSILASGRGNIFGPEYLGLSILKWDKEHRELRIDKSVGLRDWLIQMCYSELCDMFVGLFEFSRIKGVNLKSETDTLKLSAPIWKLSRAVDGCVIKPDALTSDKRGNVFVGDGVNNRILKINSFTGTVQSIFHLEEGNKEEIRDLFWSDTEPNLIVVRGNKISTYCIPKVRVNSVYTWTHKVEHNKF